MRWLLHLTLRPNRLPISTQNKIGVQSGTRRTGAEAGSNVHADLHLVEDFGKYGFTIAAAEQLSRFQNQADSLDSDRDNVG